jgi:hypothetical protein
MVNHDFTHVLDVPRRHLISPVTAPVFTACPPSAVVNRFEFERKTRGAAGATDP